MFALSNIRGALITMPHKVTTVGLLDEASPAVQIAGACNAVRRDETGRLIGDMFDGEGFVRGLLRKGCTLRGARALVVGAGGVGSAIAASLAGRRRRRDRPVRRTRANLPRRWPSGCARTIPALEVTTGSNDPAGFDVVVNATPMGMNDGDELPMDVSRIAPDAFVGEVVMKTEMTAFLKAAQQRGCRFQIGSDMLFEQIPAYLEFFGFPTTTPENLRAVATLKLLTGRRAPVRAPTFDPPARCLPMRRSIATVSLSGMLREKLQAIAAAGFDGVEIFENDLLQFSGKPAEVRSMAADLGLAIDMFQPFRDFDAATPALLARSLDRAERKFDLMQQLGTDLMLVCSSVQPDASGDTERLAEQFGAAGRARRPARPAPGLRGAGLGQPGQPIRPGLGGGRTGRPSGARSGARQLPHARDPRRSARRSRNCRASGSSMSSSPMHRGSIPTC